MQRWAITPHGIGKPVGARRIRESWPLAAGETFAVTANDVTGTVLAEDGTSLRPGTSEELAPAKKDLEERLAALESALIAKNVITSDDVEDEVARMKGAR